MGILEKIKSIEEELARTQKNKATEYHTGLLKGKLARYRTQLIDAMKAGGPKGEGFEAKKVGDARVAMVGFPSVGKSTILTKLTKTASEVASYEFTTLTCIPGVIEYNGAEIQLLDLPGIVEGASEGKGRGRQVIATARTSDLILMVLDAGKGEVHKRLLEEELAAVGIRLNCAPPPIYYKVKKAGGIQFNSTVPLTRITEKMVKDILHDYRIHNAEVLFKGDCSVDDFLDIVEGNRTYLPCLYVYNKIDTVTIEEVDMIAHSQHSVVLSCNWGLNIDFVKEKIWEYLALVRVYTKKRGHRPDFGDPVIMRKGATIEDLCGYIHRDIINNFKSALVWGTSTKHNPQRVGLVHQLEDEDVVTIIAS